MKQLTLNEINEVSGGNWRSYLIGWVVGHGLDSVVSFMHSYATNYPEMSYDECMDVVANLPNGSLL